MITRTAFAFAVVTLIFGVTGCEDDETKPACDPDCICTGLGNRAGTGACSTCNQNGLLKLRFDGTECTQELAASFTHSTSVCPNQPAEPVCELTYTSSDPGSLHPKPGGPHSDICREWVPIGHRGMWDVPTDALGPRSGSVDNVIVTVSLLGDPGVDFHIPFTVKNSCF